jgi:hypothetical protein
MVGVKQMDEITFEGTLVLEKLAEINKVDDFFDAIDSDDFEAAQKLMKGAGIEDETIAMVLKKMQDMSGYTL